MFFLTWQLVKNYDLWIFLSDFVFPTIACVPPVPTHMNRLLIKDNLEHVSCAGGLVAPGRPKKSALWRPSSKTLLFAQNKQMSANAKRLQYMREPSYWVLNWSLKPRVANCTVSSGSGAVWSEEWWRKENRRGPRRSYWTCQARSQFGCCSIQSKLKN